MIVNLFVCSYPESLVSEAALDVVMMQGLLL